MRVARTLITPLPVSTAFDGQGNQIASWNLVDLYPARWTGPGFSLDGGAVAKETLELAHNGFVD